MYIYRYIHVITSRKVQLKQTWQLMKKIAEMSKLNWTNYETGVAVESWLWVPVELMTW